jgi:hypothetical protein
MPDTKLGEGIPVIPPNGGTTTSGHGSDKDAYGQPMVKLPGENHDETETEKTWKAVWQRAMDMVNAGQLKDAVVGKMARDGSKARITVIDKDYNISTFWIQGKTITVTQTGGGDPGPDGDDTVHPRQEPQLLAEMDKDMPQQSHPRPDDTITDPRPVKAGKTTKAQAPTDSKAAGIAGTKAGAEIKWKFAGKKPGSGVTDPAEPQGTGSNGSPENFKIPQRFLLIDPTGLESAPK